MKSAPVSFRLGRDTISQNGENVKCQKKGQDDQSRPLPLHKRLTHVIDRIIRVDKVCLTIQVEHHLDVLDMVFTTGRPSSL